MPQGERPVARVEKRTQRFAKTRPQERTTTMAHMVESIMYVGQTPWHGLGQKLENAPTIEAGIVKAGMDWEVGLKALQTVDGFPVDHKATYRLSDGQILGVVGPNYRPLQNREAFQWFQPLVESGEVELHTAGSLQEGRKVWVLGKIARPAIEIAPGDSIERFVLLSNSHDGSRAVRCGFTPIRVVCANTLAMAHDDKQSKLVKCLHTKGIVGTLDSLREVMNLANSAFEATAEQYRKLAKCKLSRADLRKYVKLVLDVEVEKPDDDLPKVTFDKIKTIVDLAECGRGNDAPEIRGTAWAAYNGVTEYLGYSFGRTQDRRLDSLWWGESAKLSQRALEKALALAS
jgi:phage/plasmid-like protein (TIGR03299 family)